MPEPTPDASAGQALTPEHVLYVLREQHVQLHALGVRSLGLFGSFRRGTPYAESDLDFLLTLEHPSFPTYMAIKHLLEDLFGWPVDLVLTENLKPRIREHILDEALYVEGFSREA